jgi:hypothetical protein
MLHEETVAGATLALIRKLCADDQLKDFVLVGGTALSLQLGHRKSIDIDLFCARSFDTGSIASHIESVYDGKDVAVSGNAIFSRVAGIKIDMIAHKYDWIRPVMMIEGVRMASLEDLAAMKFNAIVESGRRLKDYVDIYYLLEHQNMQKLTGSYGEKYSERNAAIAKNALLYHSDIKFDVELHLLDREFNWKEMVQRFEVAVAEPKRVFEVKQQASIKIEKAGEDDPSKHIGKGRRR